MAQDPRRGMAQDPRRGMAQDPRRGMAQDPRGRQEEEPNWRKNDPVQAKPAADEDDGWKRPGGRRKRFVNTKKKMNPLWSNKKLQLRRRQNKKKNLNLRGDEAIIQIQTIMMIPAVAVYVVV
eukprot:UN10430